MIKLRNLIPIFFFLIIFSNASGQSVNASSFGFENDRSRALIMAFKSKYDTIIIDDLKGPWFIKPTICRGVRNKVIVLEEGVEIHALPGAFDNVNDVLITFIQSENVQIYGNGGVLCMNKEEYTTGEWRHGISLRACRDFLIRDLEIRDSGGDGVYIAGFGKGSYSENITINNIRSLNNKRQGLSIISGKDITITNSTFADTKGTLPGAGLDIEPNNEADVISNVLIENCVFQNNYHSGIMIALGRLTASSRPVSIAIKGCILNNNHSRDHPRSAAEIIIGSNMDNPVKGEVVFDQCVIENSNWGIFYSRKREDAYSVTFKDCTAKNICKDGSWPPVFLEVPNYRQPRGSLGGYFFDNLYLEYGTDVPFMVVQGSRLGTLKKVKNIKGTVTIMGLEYEDFNYINYNPESNEGVELEITRKFH